MTAPSSPSHLSNVWFSVTPLQVSHGSGCWVTTTDGEEYLDFAAGIAVNSTGHAHPKVAAAIGAQAQRFIHAQVNVYRHDLLEPLRKICSFSGRIDQKYRCAGLETRAGDGE